MMKKKYTDKLLETMKGDFDFLKDFLLTVLAGQPDIAQYNLAVPFVKEIIKSSQTVSQSNIALYFARVLDESNIVIVTGSLSILTDAHKKNNKLKDASTTNQQ